MTQHTTRIVPGDSGLERLYRRRYELKVLDGPDAGRSLVTAEERVSVGTAEQNDLVLTDPAVSRFHLRLEVTPEGYLLTDLDSTNGTRVGPHGLRQLLVATPLELELGATRLRFSPTAKEHSVALLEAAQYGRLRGRSPAMRELFTRLQAAAACELNVLIEGETGTGKELVAEEIHRHGARSDRPLVIVDCGAIPTGLIESELFGHRQGAFTGATRDRAGAFERADGGTLFLDEIGELELTLQPRLLRALESGQVKRVGDNAHTTVDVRIISATNRDLQRAVNQGTFRADLFYRLAVLQLQLPPLRQRPADIVDLIEHLLPEVAGQAGLPLPRLSAKQRQQLVTYRWPGNVRELRNVLERLVVLSVDEAHGEITLVSTPDQPQEPITPELEQLLELPFREAKASWTAAFDRQYLRRLLERCDNNVARAARQSGIDRVHLFRLLKKYGIRR